MRLAFAALALACGLGGQALAGDFLVTIDGAEFDVTLGQEQVAKVPDGPSVRVALVRKPVVNFKTDAFVFDHPSRLAPSRSDLGEGIQQTLMASPHGTLVMIQEYSAMNPLGMVDMLLDEMTKEEVQYGYKIVKSDADRALGDGTRLTGRKAVSTYKDTEYTRHVLCWPSKDAGLIVVTQFEKASPPEDAQILEVFWKTLRVTPESVRAHVSVGDYTLTVDGTGFDIDLGKPRDAKLPDGRSFRVRAAKKPIITFRADAFCFDHPSRLSPSRTGLGEGIFQTVMSSPLGTLVMVQEYTSLDPSGIVDVMLNELLKEELHYGYKITRSEATQALADGTVLTGRKAVSTYKDTEYTRHVLAYSGKDAGILVITMIEKAAPPEDAQILEVFWKTLKVTLK
jgi:hypothetical protein